MADTHETISDIIAEMRLGATGDMPFAYRIGRPDRIVEYKTEDGKKYVQRSTVIESVTIDELADRFEAALKRECGNYAAMREALKATLDLFWDIHNANRSPQSNQAYAVIRKIKAALAAPPRNCDRFKDASDAWDAYDAFVDSYRAQSKTEPLNEFGWLYAKATEKEGDAK